MRFDILGPPVVTAHDEVRLERRSHQRLLAILVLERGRPLDTDALIDRFWGEEPPPTARPALQTHISQLRRRLGERVIVTTPGGYQLDLTGHELDVTDFDGLAARAHAAVAAGAWEDAAEASGRALAIWRGTPYAPLQDDDFAAPEIARLDELRYSLIELRAEAQLALGRHEQAIPDLERHVQELPYRERLWRQLMLARVRLGRTADALAAYHEARRLFEEIGLDPGPELRELEERILREDPGLVPPSTRNNLPPRLTSFIGRERELADVRDALQTHRLVTLIGAGGSGKTRLALEAAGSTLAAFPDGVWMVDLATATDPDLVIVLVAVALGLRAQAASVEEAVTEALRGREVLVLLDNCEHLLEAAARTAEAVLAGAPGVRVLATSRAPLGLPGELLRQVQPLATPTDAAGRPSEIVAHASVQLFVERAADAAHGFVIDDDNAAAVATICRRLDGLPLAIELAASRMGALEPEDVADRLSDRFRLLARPGPGGADRHQTLEATIAWSYDHLDEAQRELFNRLGVFTGPFSLAAAEDVCAGGAIRRDRIAAILASLVEHSLLVPIDGSTGRRYRMLETIRQYARDRLESSADAGEVGRRHRDHFLALPAERLNGVDWAWLEPMRDCAAEVEAALTWSFAAGDSRQAAILAAALGEFWDYFGQPQRAVTRVRQALDGVGASVEPERASDLHVVLSGALFAVGESDEAFAEAEHARLLVEERHPSREKLVALGNLSSFHRMLIRHDPADAVAPARRALEVATALEDRRGLRFAHSMLGSALTWSGEVDDGIEHTRHALRMAEQLGSPSLILVTCNSLFAQLMLHPERRRNEPARVAEELTSRFGPDHHRGELMPWGWIGYSRLLAGRFDAAQEAVAQLAQGDPEGFERTHLHHLRGCLRWMQGRLDEAADDAAAADSPDLSPRWFHDVFDLQADVAADLGRLDQVRVTTARYLATEVHPTQESMKSAVLRSLIRAEVNAALAARGAARDDHARRAYDAFRQMRGLVARYPPPTGGTLQLETAATNLLIGEAELTRLEKPRPELWEAVSEEATFAYWKVYAMWRRAEALMDLERPAVGVVAMRDAHERAAALGASLLQRRLDELAARHGVDPRGSAMAHPGARSQDLTAPAGPGSTEVTRRRRRRPGRTAP